MRKEGRLLFFALFALAFFLLVPALIEGPSEVAAPSREQPLAAIFFNVPRMIELKAGDQGPPLRMDRPEGVSVTDFQTPAKPDVKSDANGHPLGDNTYIKAVYQSFRLEDRSG